ncbi:hypothetical protein HMPREF9946_04278 [Acetobacteraceae bacterium AT-5844]|nr:hypothetical protein HMPREF9946_04278 [Acetobacteraceae bacterium AT-5844]
MVSGTGAARFRSENDIFCIPKRLRAQSCLALWRPDVTPEYADIRMTSGEKVMRRGRATRHG